MANVVWKLKRMFIVLLSAMLLSLIGSSGFAQTSASNDSTNQTAALELDEDELLSTEEIEQLVAPIALHPDSLLSQILMASTYPLEAVEADRWVKANPDVKDDALEVAMVDKDWDPSIKALTAFPTVLDMLNSDLSWTQQLGDAFLAQQTDVLDAVQKLRKQAQEAGNLKSSEKIVYKEEQTTDTSGSTTTVIVAEPVRPEIIYVPTYNPTVVYGTWQYPSYPPYYYYPPDYNVARGVFWFGVGYAVGNNWWGGCDWGRNNVKINVNVYNKNRYTKNKINNSSWKHDRRHRKAVPYRNDKLANRHGGASKRDNKARDEFRGRADKGRRDLAKQPRNKTPDKALSKQKRQAAAKKAPTRNKKATNNIPSAKKRPAKKPAVNQRPQAQRQPKKTTRQSPYKGAGNGKSVKKHSSRGGKSRAGNNSRKRPKRSGGGRRR